VVEKYTIAVDPGIVVNPMQLKRQVEGGAVMGISHALFEEVTFDESGITRDDWISYPIPTMSDIPEIKVVQQSESRRLRRRFGSGECGRRTSHRSGPPRRNRKGPSAASVETRLGAGAFEDVTERRTEVYAFRPKPA
jgi:hypothetical protein